MAHNKIFLACLAFIASIAAQADDRPNIVFLFADDQCTYSMGCYGTPGAKTPNLDQLAADGIIFDRHYDTTAICMASRANVMTGLYEYKTGCNFEHGPLLHQMWQSSYPVLLRKAGYVTAFAGKFGFEVTSSVGKKGKMPLHDFDWWGGSPGQTSYRTQVNKSMARYAKKYPHSTLSYGAFGRDFIRQVADEDKPFCLSISFKAPHRPVSPDPKFDDVYAHAKFTKPQNYGREFGKHFSLQSRTGRQYVRFHEWKYSSNYDEVMAKYYQQIYAIDVAVGMIRNALKEHRVASNTVVVYTSDNGFMCGSHGYGSKVLPYEEASRVPLIIHDPRSATSGKKLRCRALTGNIDFAPTFLELAGLPIPKSIDGKSLVPLLQNPGQKLHSSLGLINVWGPKSCRSLAIVADEWKYIYWPYSEGEFKPTEELYSLADDPLELNNVAQSAKQKLEELRALYDQRLLHWKQEGVKHHGYDNCRVFLTRSPPR